MKYISRLIHFIQSRGLSDELAEDQALIGPINLIASLTASGALFVFLIAFIFTTDYVYMAITSVIFCMFSMIVVLHHFQYQKLARYYFALIMPSWFIFAIVGIGGYFGQGICSTTGILITYLLFKKQPVLRNWLVAYNGVLFIAATLFVTYNGPLLGIHDYPFDEIFTWGLNFVWLSIIFYFYEKQTFNYIHTLRVKNQELRQKTGELKRFTYIASHDLKSPLRNIISFLSLMKRELDAGRYEDIKEYLTFAQTGAYQMNELVEGVLEVSKIDARNKATPEVIDLNSALEKALLNIQQDIDNKQAQVSISNLPSMLCIESDFVIIFQNIIQNALKYNDALVPLIQITSQREGRYFLIHIKDNGIGIPARYHQQIFEFFKRLHTTDEYPGTGLGLGLCKKIIEKYNGTISVQSEEGISSTFSLKLPLSKIAAKENILYVAN